MTGHGSPSYTGNTSHPAFARLKSRLSRLALPLSLSAGLFCVIAGASPASASDGVVAFPAGAQLQPGTIVIRARERALYYVVGDARAIRYPIAVPKNGKEWSGYAHVNGKFANPDWTPPEMVRRANPLLPAVIPGGSPNNPMGVAALTLDRSEIAIHGTTQKMRGSIGRAASFGCIRMYNEDVADLYQRVSVGTPVVMIQ